ncbi:MAG: DUF2778 domain-containing protein [Azoarcus sp.]|jgi:hypothetical protein|nr:DUF2778 domain-containing protein [Azoarcus sp.]
MNLKENTAMPGNEHWVFDVRGGRFYRPVNFGVTYNDVYSDAPGYQNDPGYETTRNAGPIPRGMWRMSGWQTRSNNGRLRDVIVLEPMSGTNVHGRDGFLIHGDNGNGDRSASNGCIIINGADNRLRIWRSGVRLIRVQ